LTGPAEKGKTHIVAAMCEWMVENFNHYRIWKEFDLLKHIKHYMNEKGWDPIDTLRYAIDDDLIILDDIGVCHHNDWREEIFTALVDIRYSSMQPTIITTNLSKNDFYKIYEPRVGSRLFAAESTIIDTSDLPNFRELGY